MRFKILLGMLLFVFLTPTGVSAAGNNWCQEKIEPCLDKCTGVFYACKIKTKKDPKWAGMDMKVARICFVDLKTDHKEVVIRGLGKHLLPLAETLVDTLNAGCR